MLKLSSITKDYRVADSKVRALDNVSLNFRKNEFVSILGPSGCGKTTLLNIIGGLDRYTSGDVSINGVSTKKFRDGDWDVYRNHRVGFIFQSYNLIPHQTVLGNVELALTIAGVSKQERQARAKHALDRVGLTSEYHKRPNQLSGGQCQRVAIARALVNEPEILLADEPTGALDTTTSVQIMELIKEIAKEKLVIMVTHNPDLAEKYSTRIIRLLDGEVQSDSMPYSAEDEESETREVYDEPTTEVVSVVADTDAHQKPPKKREKAKMSLLTAFRLSAQNLFTKKARTIMTSVAGAIGIIGVSLVLAMSYGVQSYINNMQNDMLSGNPITVTQSAYDMSALMGSMTPEEKKEMIRENGYVNVNSMVDTLIGYSKTADTLIIQNDITQDYVDYVKAIPSTDAAAVHLDYGLNVGNNIYTEFREQKSDETGTDMSVAAIRNIYISVLEQTIFDRYSSYVAALVDDFRQIPAGNDYIEQQYEVLEGKLPSAADEIMIVLNDSTALSDVLLAQLGYYTQDEFLHVVYKSASASDVGYDVSAMEANYGSDELNKERFTYEELLGKKFTYYPNDAVYTKTLDTNVLCYNYSHISNPEWNNAEKTKGLDLKVVGIVAPKSNVSYGCMENGFYYTEALTNYIIGRNKESEIVKAITANAEKADDDATRLTNVNGGDIMSGVSTENQNFAYGVTYNYTFDYNGEQMSRRGFIGGTNIMTAQLQVYALSLNNLGGSDLASGLSIYPLDFEHKEKVLAYLDRWNSEEDIVLNGVTLKQADRAKIVYTDNLSVVISMINQFIEIVTIALVGFTALSLVVSSVMIAIITYVSVVERTKEIGVIRSLGGRKKDVSRLFTAETAIIGFSSGVIGILVTYLCTLVINIIVSSLTVVAEIAKLPIHYAAIMIGISVLLTLLSGVFPARAAAKKDPVVALRTE